MSEYSYYNSFGELEAAFDELGGWLSVASLKSTVGYTGKFFDTATGLQYNNARWYDPAAGRFASEDPARDGSNWYAYAGNDPINFYDPTGLSPAGNPLNNLYSGLGNYGPTYSSQQLFGTLPTA